MKSAMGKEKRTDPLLIRDLLVSTATPVKLTNADGSPPAIFDTVAKQGGGLANFYRAVHHTTEVSPSSLSLNDSAHASLQQTIRITNVGKVSQTYSISHTTAGTVLGMNKTSSFWNTFPVPTDPQAATVAISPAGLTLAPGQAATVTLTFTPPSLDPALVPIYSGWISVTSKEDSELGSASIPYMGTGADMSKEAVFDLGTSVLAYRTPALSDADGNPVYNDSMIFTLSNQTGTLDSPGIVARLRLGTRRITIDLVKADVAFRPTLPIVGPTADEAGQPRVIRRDMGRAMELSSSALFKRADASSGSGAFDDVPIVGRIQDYLFNPRDDATSTTSASLPSIIPDASGKNITVEDGHYRILLRASKLFRPDLSREDAFESYLTHAFEVKRSTKSP